MQALHSLIGIAGLLALAVAFGADRRRIDARGLAVGLLLQLALTWVLVAAPGAKEAFALAGSAVDALQRATLTGTSFVFGFLGGAPLPFAETSPGGAFVFAFKALPLILVVSALTALLTYWRVLPLIVRGFSWILERTLRVGGAVGLSTAANIFVGMVEAPLFIRPYIAKLSRSELFMVMVGGLAGIAGTVLALYAAILGPIVPGVAGHLLAASVLTAPSAIIIARLMVPETGSGTEGHFVPHPDSSSAVDAITKGTVEGVELLIHVVALLLVMIALVALANEILSILPSVGGGPITLQRIFGYALAPVAWLTGIPWSEAVTAGALLGTKTVLNELIAYIEMSKLPGEGLSERSKIIMTYALCGFANFGGLGILLGGLVAMAPGRRAEIVGLGGRSLFGGLLATCLTAAFIGLII